MGPGPGEYQILTRSIGRPQRFVPILVGDPDAQLPRDYYRRSGVHIQIVEHGSVKTALKQLSQRISCGSEAVQPLDNFR